MRTFDRLLQRKKEKAWKKSLISLFLFFEEDQENILLTESELACSQANFQLIARSPKVKRIILAWRSNQKKMKETNEWNHDANRHSIVDRVSFVSFFLLMISFSMARITCTIPWFLFLFSHLIAFTDNPREQECLQAQ